MYSSVGAPGTTPFTPTLTCGRRHGMGQEALCIEQDWEAQSAEAQL